MKYRILTSTKNVGQYAEQAVACSLSAAKAIVRAASKTTLHWQEEGDDLCAYGAREDMADEDRAVARVRPTE